MSAAVTITPNPANHGDKLVLDGKGFLPSTKCTLSVPELGIVGEITSDVSGEVSSVDLADHAYITLTFTTNAVADDQVVVGSVTYVFKASVTTTANEVKLGSGGSAIADSIANLKAAINASGGANYGSLTVVNPDCLAGAATATTLIIYAKVAGTAGNSLTSTDTSTHIAFDDTTLNLGAVAVAGSTPLAMIAEQPGTHVVKITDGTNTAEASVVVFSN